MQDLSQSIKSLSPDINIINCSDITSISFEELFVQQYKDSIQISEVSCSFIRYPYDLIPPHTGTFKLREKTELLKTISLLLQDCAINPITKAWQVRNRMFSLAIARNLGIKVPTSRIMTTPDSNLLSKNSFFVKAMGNCFVTDKESEIKPALKSFLHIEEDDGDYAWILPANKYNTSHFIKYIKCVGVSFVQDEIVNEMEYRIYIIGNDIFAYCRNEIDGSDKSMADYATSSYLPPHDFLESLKQYSRLLGLEYLCVDAIQSEDSFYLVDINPYGSLPAYNLLPDPTDALAKHMVEKISV